MLPLQWLQRWQIRKDCKLGGKWYAQSVLNTIRFHRNRDRFEYPEYQILAYIVFWKDTEEDKIVAKKLPEIWDKDDV